MKRTQYFFLALTAVLIIVIWNSFSQPAKAGSVPDAKAGTFRAEQMAKPRVKVAYQEKWDSVKARLSRLDVAIDQLEVFIRGFKDEEDLEVWVKQKKDATWKLYTTYPICEQSGGLGPKRCQGDYQVPEGFYNVNVFNPYSNFYLSLGVSYPNASDKIFACKRDPGGAIMIHGDCVTIGCIPITDALIKELYVLCVEAKNSGQGQIPIHLFPARLTNANLLRIKNAETDAAVRTFWDNLQTGYDWFETKKTLPKVTVDAKGKYIFS
jgi:murein L,D-transpeptidase YafK